MELQITKSNMAALKQFTADVKKFIVENNLFVNIKGKNYVYVEGWQFMGGMLGIDAIPMTLENLSILAEKGEYKYSCTVELYQKERMIGRGYAICSNLEVKKKDFDEYAVASMAQTRAVGKAYRLKIGWMMKLVGYEGTPAEEAAEYSIDNVKASTDKKADIIAKAKKNASNT